MVSASGPRTVSGIISGISVAGCAAGMVALRLLAGRSIATASAMIAVVTVAAALAGVTVTAQAAFISQKNLPAVLAVVVIAGLAGFATAVAAGRRVSAASRLLLEAVREAGSTGQCQRPPAALPAELAALSAELATAYRRLAGTRARERMLEARPRELVAWVSHDLRVPLAALRGMAEALEHTAVTDQHAAARYYGQICAETQRLTLMIDDLFELSCIHTGALRLSRRVAGLGDVIGEALTSAEPLARAKGVELRGHAAASSPVLVDAAEVSRALHNLMISAIGHTPADGSVEVLGDVESGMATVSVSDSCGGIPPDHLPGVFDVASRAATARVLWPGDSTGLGLSIARGIIEAHAGQIGIRNAGAGCQFVIRLPLASGPAAATRD